MSSATIRFAAISAETVDETTSCVRISLLAESCCTQRTLLLSSSVLIPDTSGD